MPESIVSVRAVSVRVGDKLTVILGLSGAGKKYASQNDQFAVPARRGLHNRRGA
jgi:hypothetical protein